MSGEMSDLQVHDGMLYWSEAKPDERWGMKSDSHIRALRPDSKRKRNITKGTELLYNPSFSKDKMAATRYFPEGGSALYIDG